MTATLNKPQSSRADREELRKAFAAPAWQLWIKLARNDAMPESNDSRDRMLERHKLVVAMIEVNSQQLRCDSAAAGLDIERQYALKQEKEAGRSAETAATLADIARRTAEVTEKKRKLATEREWLEASLAEFDTFERDTTQPPNIKGRA